MQSNWNKRLYAGGSAYSSKLKKKSELENLDYKFPFGIPVSSSFPPKNTQHRKEIKNGI